MPGAGAVHLITSRGTFVPLVFTVGEALQFDWSEDWAVLGGVIDGLSITPVWTVTFTLSS